MPKPSTRPRPRAPKLTTERVAAIVEVIREWDGPLTWNGLCDKIARKTGAAYTRQALNNYIPIKAAYTAYQQNPTGKEIGTKAKVIDKRFRNLQLRVVELEGIRDALLERFARWSVNAAQAGLDEDFLDKNLPAINRAENH